MNIQADIADRMARIRSIFEDALLSANQEPDNDILTDRLDVMDEQFRSIAYEGASMSRGLTDFTRGNELLDWPEYMHLTTPHAIQVHIGLGWAVSQRQIPVLPILKKISPLYQLRVMDGYGYYDGTFRHRTSIRDKVINEEIIKKNHLMPGYDQGIGRSLWYTSKGNISKLKELIEGFDTSRRSDMWRGIGIAMAYVGAFDKSLLIAIFETAGDYQYQLSVGAALLARSRFEAHTANQEADMACRIWCHLSAEEAVKITYNLEPLSPTSGDLYMAWVASIEDAMSKSVNQ
jgi:hypothetical protein